MAGAGKRSLPHCHGGSEPRERTGEPSLASFFSLSCSLWLLKAPALTLGLGWAIEKKKKRGQSGGTEIRKGLGMGQGVCDWRPTAAEGGREESRGGGDGEPVATTLTVYTATGRK